MTRYSSNKQINSLVKALIKQGWSFHWGGKHGRLTSPNREKTITVPKTPSCRRAAVNFTKDLIRGFPSEYVDLRI